MKFLVNLYLIILFGNFSQVYVLAYPPDKLVSLVRHYCKLSNILLLLLFILMVTSLSVFIFSLVTAAKREMFLYAALVKQMDATQQAERKGMNKSHAFATASHDIRASLAAIICSIEICNQDSNPNSVVAVNLAQMSTRAQELIGKVLCTFYFFYHTSLKPICVDDSAN